jgi:DNA-binding response OmpR family regulator
MNEVVAREPVIQERMTRVLLVDDDVELFELVQEYLRREGFALDAELDGTRAVARAVSGEYQLTVLDVMLPGVNGFDLLRSIRAVSRAPVLMLTARGEDVDRIAGLELGADDYLSKPFNPRELVARIRAILRRTQLDDGRPAGHRPPERLVVDDVELDMGSHVARRGGRTVDLTAVEFSLLEMLVRAAGGVVERDELAKSVLGRSLMPFDRSLDVHVSRLRKKLGPQPGGGERIKALRTVGYLYTREGLAGGPP